MEKVKTIEEMLAEIREMRLNIHFAPSMISAVLTIATDYTADNSLQLLLGWKPLMAEKVHCERLANYLFCRAEEMLMEQKTLTMDTFKHLAESFYNSNGHNQSLYDFTSFQGMPEGEDGEYVSLPETLRSFKGTSMVLKIENLDKLTDTFCSRNTYYRRAYAILADLDEEVLGYVEKGVFPAWAYISYKDGGDAIFQFSHFEVDQREPDEKYRTLYVVYRFDTTVS